jgi:class 3 adenylate cyclase
LVVLGTTPGATVAGDRSARQTLPGSEAQLADAVPPGTVTLLFTDVEDSNWLWEADREAMADASARHNRLVRDQVEIAGGRVFKTVGEAFRVVFADPSAALASAVAVQRAVGAESWPPGSPIRVRMALHAGPAWNATATTSARW